MKHGFSFLALLAFAIAASAQPITSNSLYRVTPEFPKYVTAHVEFRDPAGVRWPSFFYGKPAANGSVRLDRTQPAATLKLNCNERPQKNGDQSRRVLGELFNDPKRKDGVAIQIDGIGSIKTSAETNGSMSATLVGTIDVAGKRIPVNAPATLRLHTGVKGDEKNDALMIEFQFEAKAGELGLKTFEASSPINIRASVTAYSDAAVAAAAAKKR